MNNRGVSWRWCIPVFLMMGLCSAQLHAAEDLRPFETAEQKALFHELTAELRCPKCQNQNIADSNAVVAVDMREKTYELVQQGQNKDEVIAFMKARYGDFVHYQPPLRWSTIWLWLLPAFLLMAMVVFMFKRGHAAIETTPVDQPLADELQAIIDEMSAQPTPGQQVGSKN